ncbi:MAG: hypothetical protein IH977_15275 [Nitrospinae bacterium]|nr:hypothetical protein [Nitrospinota bacterium]
MKRTFPGFPLPILGIWSFMKSAFPGFLIPILVILSFWIIGGKDYGEAIIIAFIGGLLAAHLYHNQTEVWVGREFRVVDREGRVRGTFTSVAKENNKEITMPNLTLYHEDDEKGAAVSLAPDGEPKGGGMILFGKNGKQQVGFGIVPDEGNKGIGLFVRENETGEPGINIAIREGKSPLITILNEEGNLLWNSPSSGTKEG